MRIFQKYYYVKRYEDDHAKQNCGYVKVESYNEKTKCYFYIMNLSVRLSCIAEVSLYGKGKRINIGSIFIRQGKCREMLSIEEGFTDGQIEAIEIPIQEQTKIGFRIEMIPAIQNKIQECIEIEDREPEQEEPVQEMISAEETAEPYFAPDTKWEQIKNTYPNIHLFGDDAEVVLIKPKDLVVLTEQYQNLISNSFLLHGYYNYRQLLLLKWNGEGPKYYVGVPGNFHDREKNVAIMFGFESFENGESSRRDGQREGYLGSFGYYLKQVEI